MADTVASRVLQTGNSRLYCVQLTNISDGTGETNVVKVALSGLTGPNGSAPKALALLACQWVIQGFVSVRLSYDHTTDEIITVLAGGGVMDRERLGGLRDSKPAGGTGDVLLTTNGGSSGATYDITLVLELRD